jgi:type IV pilus assembly protein PilY1
MPLRTPSFSVLLVLVAATAWAGTDLDVFTAGAAVKPNVMIVFDNSGSMNGTVPYDPAQSYSGTYTGGTIYTRCRTWNTSCSCTATNTTWGSYTNPCGFQDVDHDGIEDRTTFTRRGNRLNYDAAPGDNRLTVAKQVVDNVLTDPANANVRFGLMTLNGIEHTPDTATCGASNSAYHNDKSILKAQVGTAIATLRTTVAGLTADDATPLAPRLVAAARYFRHDGYFTGVTDPIQYKCQKNFVVLMTDGRPQGEGDSLMSDYTGEFDYVEGFLGTPYDKNADGLDPDPAHDNPPPICVSTRTYCGRPVHSDDAEPCEYIWGGSDYLDDVAKKLKDDDLRTNLQDKQSISTYTIGFTVANSLLERTAQLGGGKYFAADNAAELAQAFTDTLTAIVADSESFMSPVVPLSQSARTQSGDRMYMGLFRPKSGGGMWAGNLKKYGVSSADGSMLDATGAPATGGDGELSTNAKSYWDGVPSGATVARGGVGELLLTRSTARTIYTNTPVTTLLADLTHATNRFQTSNALLLGTMLGLAATDTTGRTKLINFIHGLDSYDEDADGNTSEKRDWILGDIIHSSPLVVSYGTNNGLVLVGANDGMLHAFDDATGQELWAFIPDVVLPNLKNLVPGATSAKQYFVDSSPKLRVVGGKKYVVFGLGRGGSAYYALDISNKTAPKLHWRITNTGNFPNLGLTTSEPSFMKVGNAEMVFVGAGYNTNWDDPARTSASSSNTGRGVYVINLTTAGSGALLAGSRHAYLGGSIDVVPGNVAVLDVTGDGNLDRAYVGDLRGQMWRINASLTTTKLFTTPSGLRIFHGPDVVRDQGFLTVLFGTGDRSNPLRTDREDRIYAVRDRSASSPNLDEGDLEDVTTRVRQNGSSAEQDLIDDIDEEDGWYIRLNERSGEKVLASPTAFFDVFFTTFTPLSGPCDSGGDARLYALKYETGGIPDLTVDPDGDGNGSAVARSQRYDDIGKSIPSELIITLQKDGSSGFVMTSGGIDQTAAPELPNNVTPLEWRECSTAAPCN